MTRIFAKSITGNRTARALLHGPPGGLFGIDQEVVTLRGLLWQLRVPQSNSQHDL